MPRSVRRLECRLTVIERTQRLTHTSSFTERSSKRFVRFEGSQLFHVVDSTLEWAPTPNFNCLDRSSWGCVRKRLNTSYTTNCKNLLILWTITDDVPPASQIIQERNELVLGVQRSLKGLDYR